MWEIFTFGEAPFKSLTKIEFMKKITTDYHKKTNEFFKPRRPYETTTATEKEMVNIYDIMLQCWRIEQNDRPKFFNLKEDLDYFHTTGELDGYGYENDKKSLNYGKRFSHRKEQKRKSMRSAVSLRSAVTRVSILNSFRRKKTIQEDSSEVLIIMIRCSHYHLFLRANIISLLSLMIRTCRADPDLLRTPSRGNRIKLYHHKPEESEKVVKLWIEVAQEIKPL